MMFLLYVCLALVPAAAALTTDPVCDENSVLIFVNGIDTNNDNALQLGESLRAFDDVDVNGDGRLTVDELEAAAAAISPELRGTGAALLDFQDLDRDGMFTLRDIEIQFEEVDENKNGALEADEFERAVDRYCQRNQTEYGKK